VSGETNKGIWVTELWLRAEEYCCAVGVVAVGQRKEVLSRCAMLSIVLPLSPLWFWNSYQVKASGCTLVYFYSHLCECGHAQLICLVL